MRSAFRLWLENKPLAVKTVQSRSAEAARIEKCYGDLDDHYRRDRLASILRDLEYSKEDKALNRENPSKIDTRGDIYNNLNTYRSTARLYRRFRDEAG